MNDFEAAHEAGTYPLRELPLYAVAARQDQTNPWTLWLIHRVLGEGERMSTSFDDFMRDMEEEARQAGSEPEAACFESQQRH